MRYPGFIGPHYISQSPTADNEALINFYVEPIESPGATVKAALYPTPGVNVLASAQVLLDGLVGRAHYAETGREFAVLGQYFVEYDSTGLATSYGTVTLDNQPATISGNGSAGNELFITSGGNGYLFDLTTNTFSTITALAGIATMGDYLGGYFLALNVATGTVRMSDLFDGTTWDPLQFFQRSAASDGWIGMKVNQYLYLFGTETGEVWFNSGAFPIPFELHPSGRLQYGTAARWTPEVVGTSMCWLGAIQNGQGSVLRTSGFSVEVISDFSTHNRFDKFPIMADAIGDSYEEFGHIFYILTFPTANETWAFDTTTNMWAQRSTWNSATNHDDAWRPLYHAFAFGQHRMMDFRGNRLYQLSSDFGLDVESLPIRRVRRPPALMDENKLVFVKRLELLLESGLGAVTGQGSTPAVMLRWTKDGGKRFGNQTQRSAGALGEYGKRVIWNRCGAGRKMQPEFSFSDPIPWRILDCFVEAEPGAY